MCISFLFNLAAFDLLLFLKNSTPTENRTGIKGLGNLRSIHLTMGAVVWKLSKLESVAKIRILSDSAKYSYSFMYRMSRHAHLKKGIDEQLWNNE